MTSHSLLANLDDEQAELILLMGRPLALGEFADARGWPVWDFVDRTYRGRHPGGSCVDVLASLPAIVVGGRTYGLWWRSNGLSGLGLQPDERVGLSIVGLHHLWPLLGDSTQRFNGAEVCLDIIRTAVDLEQELEQNADWTTVRKGQYDLRTQRFASRDGAPVELLGQTLRREFIPLASPTTNFNYVVEFGAGRLSPLRGVQTVEDYIAVAESLSQRLAPSGLLPRRSGYPLLWTISGSSSTVTIAGPPKDQRCY
ncbi:hypothetical protein G7075_14965 [Phycicoccus sp. HDW14]|uniref:hypothetical protein n=1 Tax=Phycicoccus sp. HDW14 TaxID=2714941 RepID=UPI00140D745D|nr:hypothetical protein [Phycicoccus sp. HDW14]QIM22136.1 hypothetical protein G7075_14965 [Phycicoccus sp. HDW14]